MPSNFDGLTSGRRNNFDFLRFFLSCLVLYAHCYGLLKSKSIELLPYLTNAKIDSGGLAVSCFFIISGFLVSYSWSRSQCLTDFIARRILRIYPGWIVSLTLCFLVVAPLGGMPLEAYYNLGLLKFFGPLVLHWQEALPNVFASNPLPGNINGSLWTLPFEVVCYLFIIFLGLTGLFRYRIGIFALFVAVLLISGWSAYSGKPHYRWFSYFGSPNPIISLLPCFMAGMTFFCYREKIPRSRSLCALLLFILGLSIHFDIGFTFISPAAFTYLLFYFASSCSMKLHHFARFGDFSFGMYLYSFPIQQLFIHFLPGRLSPLTLFLSAFPIAFCCAVLSWHLVEKPALGLKSYRSKFKQKSLKVHT